MWSQNFSRIRNLEPTTAIVLLITFAFLGASALMGTILGLTKIAVHLVVGAAGTAAAGCILIVFQSMRKSRFL